VQSSWFPLFDRNPQKFCNIRQANEEDFQKATHRVFRALQYPSGIHIRVLPKESARSTKHKLVTTPLFGVNRFDIKNARLNPFTKVNRGIFFSVRIRTKIVRELRYRVEKVLENFMR